MHIRHTILSAPRLVEINPLPLLDDEFDVTAFDTLDAIDYSSAHSQPHTPADEDGWDDMTIAA